MFQWIQLNCNNINGCKFDSESFYQYVEFVDLWSKDQMKSCGVVDGSIL